MSLTPPSDAELLIKTKRLTLEPVLAIHAAEMIRVLADKKLYHYIPQDPPELEKLKKTYEFWESRISQEKDELWLNWVARWNETNQLIGHFQSGFKEPMDCSVAYTVGSEFQRQGFAIEALRAIFAFLNHSLDTKVIKAWIDTRNTASIHLVKKLKMKQVELIKKADHFKGKDSDEFVFQIDF